MLLQEVLPGIRVLFGEVLPFYPVLLHKVLPGVRVLPFGRVSRCYGVTLGCYVGACCPVLRCYFGRCHRNTSSIVSALDIACYGVTRGYGESPIDGYYSRDGR